MVHYKKEEEFAKVMKGEKPHGLYLLYGGEAYLIETWAKRITGAFGGEFDSFNLQKIDGRRFTGDELFDAVETLPLLASEKCVLLDDLDLKALPAGEQEKLWEILGDLAPACVLVITAKPGSFDQKSVAGKKLVKLCGEHGTAVELGVRGPEGLVQFLKGIAKKQGCTLSTETARLILQTCETGMGTLSNEMEKICAYAGSGEITRDHVERAAIPRTEARVFDLSKSILAGNPQRAMEILRDLFYLREQPVAIVGALAMSYADLYRARVARDGGKSQADVVKAFGYKGREFRVNNAWRSRLSPAALRGSIAVLLDCDRKLKSTGIDGRVLLEETVVRLFLLQSRESA